jgi:hypothetical protein
MSKTRCLCSPEKQGRQFKKEYRRILRFHIPEEENPVTVPNFMKSIIRKTYMSG